MNNFVESTVMKIIPAAASLCLLIWFLIPFTRGIINIGNITGTAVSAAMLVIFIFFGRFTSLIRLLWNSPAGKVLVSSVTAFF